MPGVELYAMQDTFQLTLAAFEPRHRRYRPGVSFPAEYLLYLSCEMRDPHVPQCCPSASWRLPTRSFPKPPTLRYIAHPLPQTFSPESQSRNYFTSCPSSLVILRPSRNLPLNVIPQTPALLIPPLIPPFSRAVFRRKGNFIERSGSRRLTN